jgi:hypothetical protein
MGHGTRCFASPHHQGAATRHCRQAFGHVQKGLRSSNGSIEQLAQKLGWIWVK